MTEQEKTRNVRHMPSVVADHQAYLHELMAQIDRAAISIRLGESLAQSGLKQHEMAELLHVHVRSVEDYVSPKKRNVPFDRLDEWASHTRTTTEWLLHGEEQPRTSSEANPALSAEVAEIREMLERILALLARPEEPRAESTQF